MTPFVGAPWIVTIKQGEFDLCWSFVIDYENGANPFEEVRNRIKAWKKIATIDCDLNDEIANKASDIDLTLLLRYSNRRINEFCKINHYNCRRFSV